MNSYEIIYKRLVKLGVLAILDAGHDNAKSHIDGSGGALMDLNLDVVDRNGDRIVIALSHYFEQNGDLCADPDMEIRIYPAARWAEALTFQQTNPDIYQVVYPEPGKICPRLSRELNWFLKMWLRNCIRQGHRFTVPVVPTTLDQPGLFADL